MRSGISHAGGIVFREKNGTRYLIVAAKQNPEHWVFPKGHIEPGETTEDAALREVKEETGIIAKIVQRAGDSRFDGDNEAVHVLFYLMEYLGETKRTEQRQMRWCSYEQALDLLTFDDSRALLSIANTIIHHPRDIPD
jgi:8-oxo-dGTP pyrophosphatase MutT (NUDIX family)